MAFAEVFAPFFNTAEFAVAALWNGATTVNGIFDADYLEPLFDGRTSTGVVQGSAPAFMAEAAKMPGVAHNDTLVISGTTYKVRGVEPDGTGVVLLRLEKQ